MYMVEIIERKRDGGELSTKQIEWFVRAYSDDRVPDYQAAALLMAIYLRGMNRRESVDLTMAIANSGDQLDLHDVVPFVVDKHSSGGVGDKTTLVVQPIVAACGVPVGKMSGRGLGLTGGTLDKMESIPGWSSYLTLEQFKKQLGDIGLVLAGPRCDRYGCQCFAHCFIHHVQEAGCRSRCHRPRCQSRSGVVHAYP